MIPIPYQSVHYSSQLRSWLLFTILLLLSSRQRLHEAFPSLNDIPQKTFRFAIAISAAGARIEGIAEIDRSRFSEIRAAIQKLTKTVDNFAVQTVEKAISRDGNGSAEAVAAHVLKFLQALLTFLRQPVI